MTRERRNEILEMMRDKINHCKMYQMPTDLCFTLSYLILKGNISIGEELLIKKIMNENAPEARRIFWWPISDFKSRLDFIDKLKELP